MKKFMSVLCSFMLVMTCFVLVGCKKENKDVANSKYIGTWKAVSAEAFGQKVSAEEVFEGKEVFLELKGDGTGTFDDPEGTNNTFTWVELEDGVKTSGDVNMTFTDTDGQLVGEVITVKLFFEKQ